MRTSPTTLAFLLALGCASAAPEAAAPEPAPSTAGAEAGALAGRWAEYWSVAGEVPTEQYVFEADGRWTWRAAPGAQGPVAARSGRWRFDAGVLVLSVESEEDVPRDPPLEERIELGDCPPNEEARVIDARYDCRSFGGRAFWRSAK